MDRFGCAMTTAPTYLMSGLDSLYVTVDINHVGSQLDWDELTFQKERIQQSRKDSFSRIKLGSESFALLPRGAYPYNYVLTNEDFEIRLAERMRPGCHVRFSSKGLWTIGIETLAKRLTDWFASLQIHQAEAIQVSRADWAFDFSVPIMDWVEDHFVSRANKNSKWRGNSKDETFQFGTSDPVIRVYDKAKEIEQASGKAWFHQLWGQEKDVWRVEFQVRRERLKQAGIRSLDDLFDLQYDLLRELASNHTTLRRPNGDKNRSRWPLHPLWSVLLHEIDQLPQTGLVRAIDPQKALDWRAYQQGRSLYGHLKSFATLVRLQGHFKNNPTLEEVAELLPEILDPHHHAFHWDEEIKTRIEKFEVGLW